MNRRLEMLYRLLPSEGRGLIDVGTDHAQIPIRLAENDGVDHRIRFLCSDGLALCPPDAVDTILIAGMGGDTACGILDRAEWLFSGDYRLILQPMTHAEVLRFWLVHNEFRITREAVVAEGSHVYQMFSACPGKDRHYTDAEYMTGKRDGVHLGDDRLLLVRKERDRLRKKTDGLKKSGLEAGPTFRFYERILQELEAYENNADG